MEQLYSTEQSFCVMESLDSPAENKDEKRHRTPETRVVTGCRVSVFAQLRYEALAACKTLASRPRAKQAGRAIDSAGKPVPNSACSCYLLL